MAMRSPGRRTGQRLAGSLPDVVLQAFELFIGELVVLRHTLLLQGAVVHDGAETLQRIGAPATLAGPGAMPPAIITKPWQPRHMELFHTPAPMRALAGSTVNSGASSAFAICGGACGGSGALPSSTKVSRRCTWMRDCQPFWYVIWPDAAAPVPPHPATTDTYCLPFTS
ncbi:MAG: hypothetical protein WDO12_01415 [Pseudomonadota bacterium]